LDTLANNGGPTQTILLLPGSPAIDAGSNPANLDYDQRGSGFPRVVNGLPDIGAVEGVRTIPVANASSANVATVGGTSQSVTVTYTGFNAINAATVGPGDIILAGPGG